MLLHDDIGICEECAHELDQEDFKGCAVCALKSEIKELTVSLRMLRTHLTEHLETVNKTIQYIINKY